MKRAILMRLFPIVEEAEKGYSMSTVEFAHSTVGRMGKDAESLCYEIAPCLMRVNIDMILFNNNEVSSIRKE